MSITLSTKPPVDAIGDVFNNNTTQRSAQNYAIIEKGSKPRFAIGNPGRPHGSKHKRPTAESLRDLCLDVLHSENEDGVSLIAEVIQTLARTKPDKVTDFTKALLPKEQQNTNVQVNVPIVFDFDKIE